jgi:hypothetical protein
MDELNELLDEQYPHRVLKPGAAPTPDQMIPPGGAFLVGYEDERPIAIGGLRRLDDETCEIKRMYVVQDARSRGAGRALLAALEETARELGYARLRLDAGPAQEHSRALFEKTGYAEIPKYSDNDVAVYFAEKRLRRPAPEARASAAAREASEAEAPGGEATEGEAPKAPTAREGPAVVSDELERWLGGEQPRTLGSLIDAFGERSFAIVFALHMALPALPLPTGGATHVLEVITMLLALELIAGRREIWLPQRWRRFELNTPARQKIIAMLLRRIRWLERYSRPRGQWLFGYRLSGVVFGAVTLALTVVAFLAPPFSGLDTLPSVGVVLLALGVLLTDVVVAAAGAVVGALGIVAVIGLGSLVAKTVGDLF